MTEAADLVLTNAEVHTLARPDETAEAVAIRDGTIVRIGSAYESSFLVGVETTVRDCEGRVVVPGFIDAHTHMEIVGWHRLETDLSTADSLDECLDRLESAGTGDDGWILGFGYDESDWEAGRFLLRGDLDQVSEDRPVVAFREDLHLASLNSAALERLADELPEEDVRETNGEPNGVVVESALGAIFRAIRPDRTRMRDLLTAARDQAHVRGVTGVHDMVRRSQAPRVYRDLAAEDELSLRVRLNYWRDHVDAVVETGLGTNTGSGFVQMGAVKSYSDGSIGGQTAKLSRPYADAATDGQWVVPPAELRDLVHRVEDNDLQVAIHAIGDEAIDVALETLEGTNPAARHRIEHAEVLTDDLIERLGDANVVVSAQPNFLKWARDGGLYDQRLGVERRKETNRFRALADAGARLAFGSDCMPLDPLFGIDQVVTAPEPAQRLTVTEALRAYTVGGAYAGFDEDQFGTIERGKAADLVILDESPWETDPIAEIDVAATIVDGEIVYERA
jgi:hypothetical protein